MSDPSAGTAAGQIYTSETNGDWGTAAIWSTDSVPDAATAEVTVGSVPTVGGTYGTEVTIAPGESFIAGSVDVGFILDVLGSLTAADLTVGTTFGELVLGGGVVDAGQITVNSGAYLNGQGTLASFGALTNSGAIQALGATFYEGFTNGPSSNLILAPVSYTQTSTGVLEAIGGGTLVLAPTGGVAGFTNLSNGTLSGGVYDANGGTLELPGSLTTIQQATIAAGPGQIEIGGTALQTELATIGTGAVLETGDYTTSNTLTVAGGAIELGGNGILSSGGLVLANASSELLGPGTVTGNIENDGTILAEDAGGYGTPLLLTGAVDGSGIVEIGDGAVLELLQGGSEAVTFEIGSSPTPYEALGALQLQDPGNYTGTIEGFTTADVNGTEVSPAIELLGSAFTSTTLTDVYTGTSAGGTLNVLAGGETVASLHFSGDYTQDSFTLIPVQTGAFLPVLGIDIALSNVLAPCFTRGTRVATPMGEVAVEDLRVGDRVLTAGGGVRPIVWIGQRRVDCAYHPRPELVRPVRIRAGAFGAAPHRDLLLSPDHAVFAEGVLIPVKYLVNGASIAQEPAAETHYFHVELDRHDVLLAEELPAESYLDTGNRAQFAAGPAAIALHPDFAAPRGPRELVRGVPLTWENACAPLATDGPAVLAVRRRLLARMAGLGWARRAEPQFAVLADGKTMAPETISGNLHRWVLPAGTREAHIVSSTAVPAGLDVAATDCRTLGARIGAVFVDEDFLPLGHPALAAGFHPIEGFGAVRWRWTDGCAVLVLPPGNGPRVLELLVRDVMAGWQEARAEPAMAA